MTTPNPGGLPLKRFERVNMWMASWQERLSGNFVTGSAHLEIDVSARANDVDDCRWFRRVLTAPTLDLARSRVERVWLIVTADCSKYF